MGTQLCYQFKSKGKCSKGHACTFAHGRHELRQLESPCPVQIEVVKQVEILQLQLKLESQLIQTAQKALEAVQPPLGFSAPMMSLPPGLEMSEREPVAVAESTRFWL